MHFVYEAFCRMRPGIPLAELHGKIKQARFVTSQCPNAQPCRRDARFFFAQFVYSSCKAAILMPSRGPIHICYKTRAVAPIQYCLHPLRYTNASSSHAFLRLHFHVLQEKRMYIFQDFLKRKEAVLFATDIAARGLDFPEVALHALAYMLM